MQGRRALVTGASSGLGADFARTLAGRGCNLVLVARRDALLQKLRHEIVERHGVEVDVVSMDLTVQNAPQQLYDELQAAGKIIDVLVNNAGFGLYGKFLDIPWERERSMLELDIMVLTHLTKLFVTDMVNRNWGYVLQVASVGAFQPSPTYASYAAAKSYVLNFGEALNYELRTTSVHCTVVSPGIVATEFLAVSGQRASRYQRMAMMQSPEVARIGVDALMKGRSSVVPGRFNAVSAWSSRLLPRRLSAAIAYRLMTVS